MLKYEKTTKGYYHSKMDELPNKLRAMLDDEIVADDYYLVIKEHTIVGGFTTSVTGELKGLFSLVKGLGKEIFKLRLCVADLNRGLDVKEYRLFCIGDKLRELYATFGFRVVDTIKWDNKYAPSNWNYMEFGTPDLYVMTREVELDGKYIVGSIEGLIGIFSSHDEAFSSYERCSSNIKGVFQFEYGKLHPINIKASWFSPLEGTEITETQALKQSILKDLKCTK